MQPVCSIASTDKVIGDFQFVFLLLFNGICTFEGYLMPKPLVYYHSDTI